MPDTSPISEALELQKQGLWQQAIKAYQSLLESSDQDIQSHKQQIYYQLAACFRQLTDWQNCRLALESVLASDPENTSALLELGNCWQHLGDRKQALTCYERLIELQPDYWKGLYSLARWYDFEESNEQVERYLKKALQAGAPPTTLHTLMGQARLDLGRFQDAAQQYRLALSNQAENFTALVGLACCCLRLNKSDEAKLLFDRAASLVSDNIQGLSQLAQTLWEYKFFDEAVGVLQRTVTLRPDLAETHVRLAIAYYQQWRMSEAQKSIDKALKIQPGHKEAEELLLSIYTRQGKCDESLPLYRKRIELEGENSRSISGYLFTELYSNKVSAEQKAAHHKAFSSFWSKGKPLKQEEKNKKAEKNSKPLKVGFVSADFRDQHPVGIFVQAPFAHHDKNKFEYVAYYTSKTYDESTHKIKNMVDQWVEVPNWSDERLLSKIREDDIDILVDLSGHTSGHRLKVFGMRAAPVQITWMGYPHSTGLPEMDYLIADPIVCPPENDHLCSEKVLRLKDHCVFCLPSDNFYTDLVIPKQIPRDYIVFGSFNNLAKLNEDTLNLWIDLLQNIPGSKLKLKTPSFTDTVCQKDYEALFTDAGIDRERLIFSGPSALKSMMKEYLEVDIALDTFPYSGGTTSFQALWMGVPVLTLMGDNFCGRMGASIMDFLDLSEWVVKDSTEFVAKAKTLAGDAPALRELKRGLRDRMLESALCDEKGFARDFENCLIEAYQKKGY